MLRIASLTSVQRREPRRWQTHPDPRLARRVAVNELLVRPTGQEA
jgi:hypothetical protein